MSEYQDTALLAGFALVYSVCASRLEHLPLSGPIIFVAYGVLIGPLGLDVFSLEVEATGLRTLAELTLALVLFTDSANTDIRTLRQFKRLPMRLLLIGLPLTIAFGVLIGMILFPLLSFLEIVLLAVMLAPTDAALGKTVVTNSDVPLPVREGLNVESGLNDGICVPLLLICLALATEEMASGETARMILRVPLEEIGIGILVGVATSVVGALILKVSSSRGWARGTWLQVPVVALGLLCFTNAQMLEGSGFIACFAGGLVFGKLSGGHKHNALLAAEGSGDVLALLTWVIFGVAVVGHHMAYLDWSVLMYALLSLTVVRIVPVFICLAGSHLRLDTKLFCGWFGPRGLASIVFIVIVMNENLSGADTLVVTVAVTILLSVVLHGISANPMTRAYVHKLKARGNEI